MVKLDMISGFLGAGKTTFANMLLRHYMQRGLRPIYIVNEFGQTGLDADIIKADGFEAYEMEGGCICCTLKDDVASTVKKVIDEFAPTNIVFEPSGIFIFDNFFEIFKHPEIGKKCSLGSVLTVVDSINFTFARAAYGSFIYNQIKNSATLLLSKLERTKQDVEELICDIRNINSDALITTKIWSEWDDSDFEAVLESKKVHDLSHRAHYHSNLSSVCIKIERNLAQNDIDNIIAACKSGAFGEIYRVKGIIPTENGPVLLHIAVQDAVQTKFRGMAEPSITFIGQALNESEIYRTVNTP